MEELLYQFKVTFEGVELSGKELPNEEQAVESLIETVMQAYPRMGYNGAEGVVEDSKMYINGTLIED